MIIHDTNEHKADKVTHEGKSYHSLAQPGDRGHGTFDLPPSVAAHFLQFPGWERGDPEFETPVTIKEPTTKPRSRRTATKE